MKYGADHSAPYFPSDVFLMSRWGAAVTTIGRESVNNRIQVDM